MGKRHEAGYPLLTCDVNRLPRHYLQRQKVHPHLHPHRDRRQESLPRHRLLGRRRPMFDPRSRVYRRPARETQVSHNPSSTALHEQRKGKRLTHHVQKIGRPLLSDLEHRHALHGNHNRPLPPTRRVRRLNDTKSSLSHVDSDARHVFFSLFAA